MTYYGMENVIHLKTAVTMMSECHVNFQLGALKLGYAVTKLFADKGVAVE